MPGKNEMTPYVAIDPVALLLPTEAYIMYTNWKHPNEPANIVLEKVSKQMTVNQKAAACVQAKRYKGYADAVLKTMG